MDKNIIEINREENFPYGYGSMSQLSESSSEILDALIEWSKKNPTVKIYKHIVSYSQEKVGELGDFDFSKDWIPFNNRPVVPRCHRVCRLIIYFQ
jgi:hypothetical protein